MSRTEAETQDYYFRWTFPELFPSEDGSIMKIVFPPAWPLLVAFISCLSVGAVLP